MEWTLNPLVAIAIGIGVMFFGYFFGLAEGRNQGYKRRQNEEKEQKQNEPVTPVAPSVTLPPPPSLLRLSQDDSQKIQLELDGKQVDTAGLTSGQRRRLIELLTVMRPWLEGGKPQATPVPPPKPVEKTPPPLTSEPASSPRPAPMPLSRPQANVEPVPARISFTRPKPTTEETAKPTSMVGQIDMILQERLQGTPLESKGIKLTEAVGGGVIVMVGFQRFEGVDQVPDEEIKAAIRAAIAEWETKFTPGL